MKTLKLALGLLIVISSVAGQSTEAVGHQRAGKLLVKIKILNENISDEGRKPFTVFLEGKLNTRSIPHASRSEVSEIFQGLGEFHFYVDEYELVVPPGIYTISIREFGAFELANFQLKPGTTTQVDLWEGNSFIHACDGDGMELQTTIHDIEDGGLDRYKRKPYHPVRVDKLSLKGPLNLIVEYCRRKLQDNKIIYYGAFISFNGKLFNAERIVVDEKKERLIIFRSKNEASGTEKGKSERLEINLVSGELEKVKSVN